MLSSNRFTHFLHTLVRTLSADDTEVTKTPDDVEDDDDDDMPALEDNVTSPATGDDDDDDDDGSSPDSKQSRSEKKARKVRCDQSARVSVSVCVL